MGFGGGELLAENVFAVARGPREIWYNSQRGKALPSSQAD